MGTIHVSRNGMLKIRDTDDWAVLDRLADTTDSILDQLRYIRVSEMDDQSCTECGAPFEVDALVLVLDDNPGLGLWCGQACAQYDLGNWMR